jgi:hypothetical protein
MKKTVAICDECKENIAKFKCRVCDADICKMDRYGKSFDIRQEDKEYRAIQIYIHMMTPSNNYEAIICKSCADKIKNQFKVLYEACDKNYDKFKNLEQDMIDELLVVIEKYAKILVI